jgi:enoyl-CoA hydratase/carnithine racemase
MAAAGGAPPRDSRPVPPPDSAKPASLVLVERKGPVVVLTLNNPPLNVLTTLLLDELRDRVLELTKDPRVRALVITGSGDRAFSGGADVREMLPMTRAAATRHSAKGQALYTLLERAPLPVIAAVRGFCVGGGCEMVQACDFIVASEDAFFGQPEINIGVIPGWGGSRRLTRTIGPTRARRWIMTGDRVGATEALRDGFLDRVVPAADLLSTAVELATTLARKSPDALAAAKYLVNHAVDPSRRSGLDYERKLWGLLFETSGQREGMRAFIEKRSAEFPPERSSSPGAPRFPWDGSAPSRGNRPRARSPPRGRERKHRRR